MDLIEGVALSKLCDYSFGDQSGQWSRIYTSFMKEANLTNIEFVSKLFEIQKTRDYMTLFIDNIRLYERPIEASSESDSEYIKELHKNNDLLKLCSDFPEMKFVIFTNLEDTPIDDYIFERIPENVVCISAVNAVSHGGKVIPSPYGLQRKLDESDIRIDLLKYYIRYPQTRQNPNKWLYVSHNENTNSERGGLKNQFKQYSWSIVDEERVPYEDFLDQLNSCKFMLCPKGNAIDCHRNWEVLYMRRVPIMKRHPYLEHLFKPYPVLFVDDYSEVTIELLIRNWRLYKQAQEMDLSKISLNGWFINTMKIAGIYSNDYY